MSIYGAINACHPEQGYTLTACNLNTGEIVASMRRRSVYDVTRKWLKKSEDAVRFVNKYGVIIVWNPSEKIFYEEVK